MSKTIPTGTVEQTSWIPDKFAVVGKVLKLRDEDGNWENGWIVKSAGNRLEESQIPDYHSLIKGHRKMTGDSEPKKKQ